MNDNNNIINKYKWANNLGTIHNLLIDNNSDFVKYLHENEIKYYNYTNSDSARTKSMFAAEAIVQRTQKDNKNLLGRIKKHKVRFQNLNPEKLEKIIDSQIFSNDTSIISLIEVLNKAYKNIRIRMGIMKIEGTNNELMDFYPPISILNENFLKIPGIDTSLGKTKIIENSLLVALYILILHPFLDGNGRAARTYIMYGLKNALGLSYLPCIDPFWSLRSNFISNGILSFRKTNDPTKYLIAAIAAIRDSLREW